MVPSVRPIASSQKMRAHHQQQRSGQAGCQQVGHLRALQVGAAEVALQQLPQVACELFPDRPVEAELHAHQLDLILGGGAAGHHARRIGRQHIEQTGT